MFGHDTGSEASRMAQWEDTEWAEEQLKESEIERLSQPVFPKISKKLGNKSYCEACMKKYTVKHPSQRFCSRKCKDWYHNTVNPERAEHAKYYSSK